MSKVVKLTKLILPISIIGLIDSSYLAYQHFTYKNIEVCPLFGGCNDVLLSKYSEIFGVPTALFGVVFYASVLTMVILLGKYKQKLYAKLLTTFTTLGFLLTLWLVYLQLFVINAICFYCMISAFTSTLLFVLGIALFKQVSKKENKTE